MVFEIVFQYIVNIIDKLGYIGIFVFMILESMVFPIPSEAVMPFAGFLVAQGKLDFILVAVISGIASLIGSLLSYYIGYFGGRKFLKKFGKYLLIENNSLKWTEKFFNKYGEKTIFIGRFVPVVRHLISIPAGIGKMNLFKFSFYTVIGASVWNVFLLYVGFWLNTKWEMIYEYSSKVDIVIIVLIAVYAVYHIYNFLKKRNVRLGV